MPSSSALRQQLEATLARRIPAALTPKSRIIRPVAPTGIRDLDALLNGGLPLGAISEFVGPECSGRTSVALSFVAQMSARGNVCAWVDISNSLDPESAAAAGINLKRLLWVRCGAVRKHAQPSQESAFRLPHKSLLPPAIKKGLHGGGFGPHPRTEIKGISTAIGNLLQPEQLAPRCAEMQPRPKLERETVVPVLPKPALRVNTRSQAGKPWQRLEQALRATDLLLQAGGFAAIVLDMASLAPEHVSRVPLATWFRYRAAVERAQTCLLLLTQHACAKSSGEILLRFEAEEPGSDEPTVFTGMKQRVAVERQRFAQSPSNIVPMRKPPQPETNTSWRTQSTWAGMR
ncbi:MAG: recombinase RecA [Terracidiphilus sp.]